MNRGPVAPLAGLTMVLVRWLVQPLTNNPPTIRVPPPNRTNTRSTVPLARSGPTTPRVTVRSRLCRHPGRLWRIAGTTLALSECRAVAVTISNPPSSVGGSGPIGRVDRSGAQTGFEPAVAADAASLSSAPPDRYELSTPVHPWSERHPRPCETPSASGVRALQNDAAHR